MAVLRPNPARPPGGRKKEKKIWVGLFARRTIGPLLSMLTETMDFIGAFYKALPRCVRPRGFVGPHKAAQIVYDNYDYIDWRIAIGNLFAMQAEDYIIGRTSQIGNEFSANAGMQQSVLTGLRRILEPLGIDTIPDTGAVGDLIRAAVNELMSDYVPPEPPC